MKRLLIKSANWILAGLMGLFGFAGCDRFAVDEYGVPSATYTVKGTIVNNANEAPIARIRVGYYPETWDEDAFGSEPEYWSSKDYVTTNTNGEFTLTSRAFPDSNKILPVYVEDIDGEENGSFQSKKVDIDFKDAVHSGKPGNWYEGEFTITTTIQLVEATIE